jgi:hypothetical protein
MNTFPAALPAQKGFSFDGLSVWVRDHNGFVSSIWSGEFHAVVGDGKAFDFASSLYASQPEVRIYFGNSKTGEVQSLALVEVLHRAA